MPQTTATSTTTSELITRFQLQAHPEGGYFRETYRSGDQVLRTSDEQTRSAATAIYYLLCDGAHSRWHRIKSDEIWHFYAGTPLLVHVLNADRSLTTLRLGNALTHDDVVFQAVVAAGLWFAAECAECTDSAGFALVGCTVAPGFEFTEFELADTDTLLADWPQHRALISKLGVKR